MNRHFKILWLFLSLFLISSVATANNVPEEYRLGPGDTLNFSVWIWGFEEVKQQQVTVRPDGQVALAFNLTDGKFFRLGPGDVLDVSVWGFSEYQAKEYIIRPDGKFAFPMIGEVDALGKTPEEMALKLTQLLDVYIKNPKVTVNVVKFRTIPLVGEFGAQGLTLNELSAKVGDAFSEHVGNPRVTIDIIKFRTTRVYVLGEVNKPGLYEIEKEHRVMDALSIAGGFARSAAKTRVYLVRNGEKQKYQEINLVNMLKKGDLTQNYVLNSGDILYLTRNGLDFAKDILPFITAIYQIKNINE